MTASTDDAMVEIAARALFEATREAAIKDGLRGPESYDETSEAQKQFGRMIARAVIAAISPLIAAKEGEACAKIASGWYQKIGDPAVHIASAIRSREPGEG